MADLQSALKDGHLVTVGALNKVYRYVLNELDKLNERTVDLYQVQGSVENLSDLWWIKSANNGDVYNVKKMSDDSADKRTNVNYVCITQYRVNSDTTRYQKQVYLQENQTTPAPKRVYYTKVSDTPPVYEYVGFASNPQGLYYKDYEDLKVGDKYLTEANVGSHLDVIASFWDALGGELPEAKNDRFGLIKLSNDYAASNSTYGLVKTGYERTIGSNNYVVSLQEPLKDDKSNDTPNGGKAYVNIPDASSKDKGVIQLGYEYSNGNYPVATANSKAYVNVPVSAPLSYADEGNVQLDYNTNLGLDTVNNKLYNSGVITAVTGDSSFSLKIKTGNDKPKDVRIKDANKIVHSEDKTTIGGLNAPVYIDNNIPKEIKSLSLNATDANSPAATFSGSTYTAVKITGPGVDENIDPKTATVAALFVNGGIIASNGITSTKVYHAVWNDISDAVEVQDSLDVAPGFCYYFNGKEYHKTSKYCQKGIIGIHSDTAGDVLGKKGKHKELDIAIGGFVLAHVDREYEPGTPLTSTKDGLLTKMKRHHVVKYPERLVGTYWKPEPEEEWGAEDHKVPVCGRHWIKVK